MNEPTTPLPPHQQRVLDEKSELDEKRKKLDAFFSTPLYAGLAEGEKERMTRQSEHMRDYSEVLGERIAAF